MTSTSKIIGKLSITKPTGKEQYALIGHNGLVMRIYDTREQAEFIMAEFVKEYKDDPYFESDPLQLSIEVIKDRGTIIHGDNNYLKQRKL